ncbi:MAG: deoxyribodipyrimidine photo-lyase [Bryobacterales bacterium]|nr:deoxyribodipyrimidine photo-lyase [Bryobacterales bacterium]
MSLSWETDPRVRKLNDAPFRANARYVLYWAQINRRVESNHALAFAAELANELDLPLLYFEGVTYEYPHANDRLHTFLLEGVPDTARRLHPLGVGYVFYLRRTASDPADVLERLSAQAAALVTDDFPVYLPRWLNERMPARLDLPYFVVDSSCVVPASLIGERQYAAFSIRPKIRKLLPRYLRPVPRIGMRRRWEGPTSPYHVEVTRRTIPALVASCQIDHRVAPSPVFTGGAGEAEKRLRRFLERGLALYARERNNPGVEATSNLSPYLHFGHISALEVALRVQEHAARHGLMAEEFLEQLIVRRELAFNFCHHTSRVDSLDELPEWARRTLARHDSDPREHVYSFEQFLRAETHDEIWNAAQKELLLTGKIHGYARMYWGKKIIEWSASHREALRIMIELHDRLALDGRDPNTYTNILWCFGLHDRPWRERPVFGTVRYFSRQGFLRKTDTAAYLARIRSLEAGGSSTNPLIDT